MPTREPVAVGAAFTAFVNSVLAVLVLAGVWEPSADLIAGINLIAVNLAVLVGAAYGRALVVPVINVPAPAAKKAPAKKKP